MMIVGVVGVSLHIPTLSLARRSFRIQAYHRSLENWFGLAEEFIFTESHGAVGSVMASAEWSFGTICQCRPERIPTSMLLNFCLQPDGMKA